MAINTNFPNVRPSLLLDFANSQQLDSRITFSRSTTAPYYDGKTSVVAEQNLALQSQTASFISGAQTGLTITGNTTVAPDGTTTGTTVAFAATTSYGYQSPSVGQILGTTYTYSVWVWTTTSKATISVRMANNSNGSDSTFSSVSLTTTPTRISVTRTFTNSGTSIDIGFDNRVAQGGDGIAGSIVYWGAQLEQRSSVTAYNATTTTAITNYIPQLLTAPINAPRFDFNPTTGESLGLLIEQSSTNLLTYSQDFTNGAWTKINSSATANTWVAPDGTITGSTITNNSGSTGWARARQGVTTTIGTAYTASAYFKTGSTIYSAIVITDSSDHRVIFNLSNGTTNILDSGVTATIIAVGNNVYRCTVTLTSSATTAVYTNIGPASVGSYNSLANDYVFAWGAQLEALAFPTSYIATTSAQVTRASDNASMTGTNFSSWYNNGQGTLYSEVAVYNTSAAAMCVATLSDGTTNNRMELRPVSAAGSVNSRLFVVTSNSAQADIQTGTTVVNTFQKISAIVQTSNFILSVAGASGTAVTTGQIPVVNQLTIGNSPATLPLNGRIKKLAYYSQVVTQVQNQALTGS
jgi:hypothetical protein